MKKFWYIFVSILATIGIFEFLFWLHGQLELNLPVDFTGVTTLTVWAAVLTVVFTVFAILGLLNIDNRIKELSDLKRDVAETNSQMKEQLGIIKRSAEEERARIVKKAQDEVIKIMDKSAKRQNLFDRLTQIANMIDPVSQIKNYTEILKTTTELDGVNISFVLCRRGEAYQRLSRDEEAQKDFNEAIRKAPESPEGYIVMGCFLIDRKKDYLGSITYFEKAIELDPTQAAMYTNIANSYAKLGNMNKADEYYSKARDYNVEAAEWYYNKSVTLRNTNAVDPNHEIEEGYLRHSLRLNPLFFPSALNLTRIMQERKEWMAAHEHLTGLIAHSVQRDYVNAIIQRGETRLSIGLPAVALADFQWAFNLFPTDLLVIERIARCHLLSGDLSNGAQFATWGLQIANTINQHEFDDIFHRYVFEFEQIRAIHVVTNKTAADDSPVNKN